jgi:membrane fusion protein, copper/silver efflux system
VETTGQPVRKGQLLFTLYSPELYAAQQEYLLARQSASQPGQTLARAARKRLELLGLPAAQIDQITARGEPLENVPFLSPASGYILEKDVVEGAAVQAGARLFRIAPLHKVWVQADVYEQDLRHVKVGQKVEVTFPYLPEEKYESKIAYIYPALEGMTRTARARIELPNPDLVLKPDMFADVTMHIEGGERLQVPEAAVIYTGPRRLVFVDLGDGRLRPQEVELGIESGDAYEVLGGLSEGDRVVTSGNFLIAAESRIRSAAEYWTGGDDADNAGGDDAAE